MSNDMSSFFLIVGCIWVVATTTFTSQEDSHAYTVRSNKHCAQKDRVLSHASKFRICSTMQQQSMHVHVFTKYTHRAARSWVVVPITSSTS